jgi:precorrin-6B methylase 2
MGEHEPGEGFRVRLEVVTQALARLDPLHPRAQCGAERPGDLLSALARIEGSAIICSVRHSPPRAFRLATAFRPAAARLLDLIRGIETSRRISAEQLGFVGTERINYRPTGWRSLKPVFRRIPTSAEDVFVDFGSGKGRVVLEAARHPFRRVIGVEISPELHEIAKQNLQRSRQLRRCPTIELVNSDALEYPIPDDVTVAYFFNPFRGRTFDSVTRRLAESVERTPRRVTIVYMNPLEEQTLLEAGARLVEQIGGVENEVARSRSIGIYSLEPV